MFSQKLPTSYFDASNFGFILIIALLSFSCASTQKINDVSKFVVGENEKPMIIAHRGGRDLFPENTMVAFDGSHELKVDALEMDVCLTKDGRLVTIHDLTIDRTSDGQGKVVDFTLQELQQLNFGYHFQNLEGQFPFRNNAVTISTIDDVMAKYGGDYPLIIELKNKSQNGLIAAKKLNDLIEEYNIGDNVVIASFHDEVLKEFRALSDNKIITATTFTETKKYALSRKLGMPFLFKPQSAAVQIPMEAKGINLAKKGFTKMAHRRNMIIQYWTINKTENMQKLINFGVDGIMTDRPDLLIDLYEKMKLE